MLVGLGADGQGEGRRVYDVEDLNHWRARPHRQVWDLKDGMSRVVDALTEVAVAFGEM